MLLKEIKDLNKWRDKMFSFKTIQIKKSIASNTRQFFKEHNCFSTIWMEDKGSRIVRMLAKRKNKVEELVQTGIGSSAQ